MTRFAKTGGAVLALLAFATVARAEPYYGPCGPERVIDSLATAVLRVAPLFMKPKSHPAPQPVAQVEPSRQFDPSDMTREQWKQYLIDGGRKFCVQYPDDEVCR